MEPPVKAVAQKTDELDGRDCKKPGGLARCQVGRECSVSYSKVGRDVQLEMLVLTRKTD